MNYTNMNHIELMHLFHELIASLRGVNNRISELRWVIKKDLYDGKKKKEILDKVKRLAETRMCIIYSIQDLKEHIKKSSGGNIDIGLEATYQELKKL